MSAWALLAAAGCAWGQSELSEETRRALASWGAEPAAQEAPRATPRKTVLPVTKKELETALAWGARNLEAHQWQDGSWGQNRHVAFGTPNTLYVRVANTAIVLDALERLPRRDERAKTLAQGRRFLLEADLKEGDDTVWWRDTYTNYKPYALAYGLSWLLRQDAIADKRERVKQYLEEIDKAPLDYSFKDDGARNAPSSSFQVALLLLAVCEAEAAGHAPPEGLKTRLAARLEFAGEGREGYYAGSLDAGAGAVGRAALLRLARQAAAGKEDAAALADAVTLYRVNREELAKRIGSGPLTHDKEKHHWAPYYYLFGMRYAALALKRLPREKARGTAEEWARALLDMQENAGGWQDSGHYSGRSYGTAFAMLTLLDLAEILELK